MRFNFHILNYVGLNNLSGQHIRSLANFGGFDNQLYWRSFVRLLKKRSSTSFDFGKYISRGVLIKKFHDLILRVILISSMN